MQSMQRSDTSRTSGHNNGQIQTAGKSASQEVTCDNETVPRRHRFLFFLMMLWQVPTTGARPPLKPLVGLLFTEDTKCEKNHCSFEIMQGVAFSNATTKWM